MKKRTNGYPDETDPFHIIICDLEMKYRIPRIVPEAWFIALNKKAPNVSY